MNDHPLNLTAHLTYRRDALLAEAEASRLTRQQRATHQHSTVGRWVGTTPRVGWLLRMRLLVSGPTAR